MEPDIMEIDLPKDPSLSEEESTLDYLREISIIFDILGSNSTDQSNNTTYVDVKTDDKSGEYYMDKIAHSLLFYVSHPEIISKPIPDCLVNENNIQLSVKEEEENDISDKNHDTMSEGIQNKLKWSSTDSFSNLKSKNGKTQVFMDYKSRVDFLRNILRIMAPIAMDVAVRVTSLVSTSSYASTRDEDHDTISHESKACAFILFGIWLQVSPQLGPIASHLFNFKRFTSPFECFSFYNHHNDNYDEHHQKVKKQRLETNIKMNMEDDDDNNATLIKGKRISETKLQIAYAAHHICQFFYERGEFEQMKQWWDWSGLFRLLNSTPDRITCHSKNTEEYLKAVELLGKPTTESDEPKNLQQISYNVALATKWHAARAISNLMNIRNLHRVTYLQNLGLENEIVPWIPHPWKLLDEEELFQKNQFDGVAQIIKNKNAHILTLPNTQTIRNMIPLHPSLVHLGKGIVLPKKNTILAKETDGASKQTTSLDSNVSEKLNDPDNRKTLILTPTTAKNISLIGLALCSDPHPPPILVCGPRGSGKSSLIREITNYCSNPSDSGSISNNEGTDDLLELHIDDETDSKTLLGSYAATDIPGEFAWRPGALTIAVRTGKWVLLEDVESCPLEVQAALVKLFEERILPLGIGKNEKCHPNFRLFGTCTTKMYDANDESNGRLNRAVAMAGVGGKKILHPHIWRKVHVQPLPFAELEDVTRQLYPSLPSFISESALKILRLLDTSGRADETCTDTSQLEQEEGKIKDAMKDDETSEEKKVDQPEKFSTKNSIGWRNSSVRDYMKLLMRIKTNIQFEPGVSYATESQRMLCLAETIDIFAASCPNIDLRRKFIVDAAAPIWGVSIDLALRYNETRSPSIQFATDFVEVGRARLSIRNSKSWSLQNNSMSNFAETNYALRLMEAAAVSITQNEPTLLVGGKSFLFI